MADPTPVAGLPDREYLELFNAGSTPERLKSWILELNGKQKIFPDVSIEAGGFLLVVAPGGGKDLQIFGKVIEISGFGLTNSGMVISLYTPEKLLFDRISYLPGLHTKGFGEGGYSLERIDPFRFCGQGNNWTTTLAVRGGTPGAENSVAASNPDHTPPQIVQTTFAANSRLEVLFTEPLQLPANLLEVIAELSPGVIVDSVKMDQTIFLMQLWFRPTSVLNGHTYSLVLHGMKDECGNPMADYPVKFGYYLPGKSDLLISEVLFNPFPDGTDFVEIYNNSSHEVDLAGLFLASRNDSMALTQISPLSSKQQYLAAGSYLAITKNKESIQRFYRTGGETSLLQVDKFPTLTDQDGIVILLNKSQEMIDEMSYKEEMHDPLITETEGISLERISFDAPTSRKENWHSAAKSAGFATPGYKNSVSRITDSTRTMIHVDPLVFSPNGDQFNDQLNICLPVDEPGWIVNITVVDSNGRFVRKLANNLSVGSSDVIVWDGLGEGTQRITPGIYVLNILLFSQTGIQRKERIACIITDRW